MNCKHPGEPTSDGQATIQVTGICEVCGRDIELLATVRFLSRECNELRGMIEQLQAQSAKATDANHKSGDPQ